MKDTTNLLIRLPRETHEQFKEACASRQPKESMQTTAEKLIAAYVANHNERQIRHLNGELCPISGMIIALASSAVAEMENVKHAS